MEGKPHSRIKRVTVRFNVEARPFQHIRVEGESTITGEDDPDQVKEELLSYVKRVADDVLLRIYGYQNTKTTEEPPTDDTPY